MSDLKIYRMYEDAQLPTFASAGSACFDLHAYIHPAAEIIAWTDAGTKQVPKRLNSNGMLVMYPNERLLIPTGLIFDIPKEHYVRLYARSGNAFKQGLVLANGVGIIDNDYVEEVKIMLHNVSDMNNVINMGDRLCQGEMVQSLTYSIIDSKRPKTKTERNGGFGTTGA